VKITSYFLLNINRMTFKDLNLCNAITRALAEKGYHHPTSIQLQAIPQIISGQDVVASAATGTGKTAAFCLPLLELLSRNNSQPHIRALILTPTRELAIQVYDNLKFYGKYLRLNSAVIYGGVSQFHQVKEIKSGVDILVATPGRLHDLMGQGILSLKHLQVLVLDEADRMLDMGFINDVKKLIKVIPASRQNIMFSATIPQEVQALMKSILRNPVAIKIESNTAKPQINQSVYYVPRESKRALLKHVIAEQDMQNVIVFARTKHGADKIAKDLNKSGITAEAIHGDKSQNARQRALSNFKRNATRVLVATDIASRGIDIVDLPFVINYELPESAETYTHRIGRTGRAGQAGWALSFCDREERGQLSNINRVSQSKLTVVEHPFI
jgi:ATP-dependent RNA helicase RhlE